MSFIVVGTNHKYSPIQIRERLSFSLKTMREALVSLLDLSQLNAVVILSTCNRIEFYASILNTEDGIKTLKDFLSGYHHLESRYVEPYLYTYIGKEAVAHLFRVASGLDSQIIGESQILEQVRFAYGQAKTVEATDRWLDSIFEHAIRVSLRVRQQTKIAQGRVSIGSIVVELIRTRCSPIKDKKILIIGVGKISELLARYLKKEKIKAVFIANRTYAKAVQLAKYIDADVLPFDRLKEKLKDTDIIISATASPHLILKKEDILEAINQRPTTNDQRLLIIDLALPRDVDPEVKDINGISLFCLDDLDFVIKESLKRRKQEIPKADKIIEEGVKKLCQEESLELEPVEATWR